MYCPCCGQKNLYNQRFCNNCGYYLKESIQFDFSKLQEKRFKNKRLFKI